jgi:hypothetical protein
MQGVNKVGIRVYNQYTYHSLNGKDCIYYNKLFSIRVISYLKILKMGRFNILVRSLSDYLYNPEYKLMVYEDFFNDLIYRNDFSSCRVIRYKTYGIQISKHI